MFNWTTTTIINELPLMKSEMDGKALRIGKHLFEKKWVESIRKAEGHKPIICSAELNLTKVKESLDLKEASVARLYIYVGLDGSEESIYANDWYRKGMPLSVSFINDTAEKMAKAIVDTVNRFNVFTKVKKVLEVTENNGILTIKGTHEHQRIQKIKVLVDEGFGEEIAVLSWDLSECRYVGNATYKTTTGVDLIEAGKNGFGTYSQLLKDLRLPTAVHNNWLSVQKDEMPIVGSLYTQYIITYYAPSMANPSFTAIGNRSMSETTHVFWVKSDLVEDWEEILTTIDPEGDGLNTNQVEVATINDVTVHRSTNKKTSLVDRVETLESKSE